MGRLGAHLMSLAHGEDETDSGKERVFELGHEGK